MPKLKIAIVVLADTETYEGMGRVVNAMEAVKELMDNGDEIRLIFDGAGVKWPVALAQPEHKYHRLYQAVSGSVAGVCEYCANAFGVHDAAQACGTRFLDEYEGHPSFRKLLQDGLQVITF
jgi:hypothetical protein